MASDVVQVPVTVPVTRREALHRAADLLEEFGWCQWSPARDEDGWNCLPCDRGAQSFCLTGSIERAVFDLTGHDMRANGPLPGLSITNTRPSGYTGRSFDPRWNNAPGRTKAEVVALLRERAEEST